LRKNEEITMARSRKQIGIVNGQDWWTNGSVMFRGVLAGEHPKQSGMQRVFDKAIKGGLKGPLTVGVATRNREYKVTYYSLLLDKVLAENISEPFFQYAYDKKYTFWLGGDFNDSHSYIICKKGEEIVGVIAPLEMVKGEN